MIKRPRPDSDLDDIWQDEPIAPPRQAVRAPAKKSAGKSRKTGTRPVRARPRRRWVAVAGYGALTLACLGVAAIAFLLVAAPVDLVRDRIVEQVKARTGRDLVIAGPTTVSIFPRPAVSLSDVVLSAPEGMDAPPILAVPAIDAELRLWSLLMGQPAVDRLTLHRPAIELSVDKQGRRSWEVAGFQTRRPRTTTSAPATDDRQAPSSSAAPAEPRSGALAKLGAGSIKIVDGTVRYRDEVSGTLTDIEKLNFAFAAEDAEAPLKIDGTLTVRGVPLAIAGTISPLQALFANQPTQMALKVSGPPFEATYQGTLEVVNGLSLDGALRLQAASARALGDWLGRPLAPNDDTSAVTVSANLKATPAQVAISSLQVSVGATGIAGSLVLDAKTAGTADVQKRRLTGNLDLSELDLGRLFTKPGRKPDVSLATPPAAAPPPTVSPSAERHSRSRTWSDDPINLSLLGLLDVNLAVSAGRLVYQDIKTGPSKLSVSLENGVARITLESIELYGGRGRGLLTLDSSGAVLVSSANLKLDGVTLRPLLADALNFPWLEGRGDVGLALAGKGLTERQIIETLAGKVDIASADGAVVGLDVSKIVRNLQRGRLPSLTLSPEEKTSFSELSGTFTISNGVAKNQDLKLISSHLQLNGEGTIDLGPRQIDYTMRTKLAAGEPEAGATIKVGSIEVPISIVGPWERPNFGIKGQEQLSGTLRQIGRNLKSQDVRDAVKGLLQGDDEKRVKPRELLDKLLKKD
jgi:AsmA protein